MHTPQSWHALLHTGRKLVWATAKSSDVLFDIGGKVKVGHDLTSEDRKEFDKAVVSYVPHLPANEAYGAGGSKLLASHAPHLAIFRCDFPARVEVLAIR